MVAVAGDLATYFFYKIEQNQGGHHQIAATDKYCNRLP